MALFDRLGPVHGKIGGAGLGLLVGGPLGALIGAVAGHWLLDAKGALLAPTPPEIVFTTGLVALAAKMAKADGVVLEVEIEAFRRIVTVEEGERAKVEALFALASRTSEGYEAYARQLAELFRDEPAMLEDVLDGLFLIAAADGAVHEKEYRFLEGVAEAFGFDEARFSAIAARHVRLAEDPYAVLGVARDIEDAALKSAWRRLVSEHHPDRAERGRPSLARREPQ